MARRALLIGSQTYGLAGCDGDVALMRGALNRRGFDPIDVRTGEDATRAGIVEGFEQLIGATGPDDAAVVYYSGHGGRVARPDGDTRRASGSSAYWQFIVPFDIDESEEGDFRGLLSEELTILQRRLTHAFGADGASANVTTILDCCHSGYLVRDADLVPKSIALEARMFRMMGIRARAAELASTAGLHANPHAVRLVACQEEQSAFERSSARGGRHGVLTDALVTVLDDLSEHAVSWTVIGDAVRRRVQALVPDQRPEVEGPSDRLLFSQERDREPNTFPVTRQGGEWMIEAAAVLGIGVGDVFALRKLFAGTEVAGAIVRSVDGGNATLDVTPAGRVAELPTDLRAVARRLTRTTRRIAVAVAEPTGSVVRRLVDEAVGLTTDDAAGPVFATVADDSGMVVLDDAGARARAVPERDDEPGVRRVVELLELLASARNLRELDSGPGPASLDEPVAVQFVTTRDGVVTERSRHGERLVAGERANLTLTNLSGSTLYAWVFDIGISGRVTLVTGAAPSGFALAPSGNPDDTRRIWDIDGGAVLWPPDVPAGPPSSPDAVRPETLVVLIADRRQDLSGLATPGGGERDATALDGLAAEVHSGRRTLPAAVEPRPDVLRYRVETVDFFVVPSA